MTTQGAWIIIFVCALGIVSVFRRLRRGRMAVDYALGWTAVLLGSIALMAWPRLLWWVTKMLGALYPVSALTLLGFAFLIAVLMFLSSRLSFMTQQIEKLARAIALLEKRIDETDRAER